MTNSPALPLEPIERAALECLLADADPVLRAQLATVEVVAREMTGVGFFTDLRVAPGVERVVATRMVFGDAFATLAGTTYGVGFLLFVEDGVLVTLEGYTYGEDWPAVVETFVVSPGGPSASS